MLTPSPIPPPYRRELKALVPSQYLKPDNRHLLWLAAHFALVMTLLLLLVSRTPVWLIPIVSLIIGHSFGCMGFIAHEICHGGAIRNQRLRHFLAGLAFSPFAIGPLLWSRWHNAEHHGHTQDSDLDPDRLFLLEEYQNKPILKWLYRRSILLRNLVIFSFFCIMMSEQNFSALKRYLLNRDIPAGTRAAMLFQFLVPKLGWIVVTALLGWQVLVFGYIIPLLVGNFMVISYISTNHFLNPLVDESDVLASSLSVTLPKWLGWLDALHSHFGAHVSHHLFPMAPSRHARKIEQIIAQRWPERYHVMPLWQALRLLWNTPWIYDENGRALIDPHRQEAFPTLGNGLVVEETRIYGYNERVSI